MSTQDLLPGVLTRDEGKHQEVVTYRVNGIIGGPLLRRKNALEDASIPADGDPHPGFPELAARRFRVRNADASNENFDVEVTFMLPEDTLEKEGGSSGNGQLSMSVDSYVEATHRDKDDAFMHVTYTDIVGIKQRTVSLDVEKFTVTATLTIDFPSPHYTDMGRANQINTLAWGPWAPQTVLYRGCDVAEQDDATFRHRYVFSHNPRTWKFNTYIYVRGFIAFDVTAPAGDPPGEHNGISVHLIYDEFDFNALLPVSLPPGV